MQLHGILAFGERKSQENGTKTEPRAEMEPCRKPSLLWGYLFPKTINPFLLLKVAGLGNFVP